MNIACVFFSTYLPNEETFWTVFRLKRRADIFQQLVLEYAVGFFFFLFYFFGGG